MIAFKEALMNPSEQDPEQRDEPGRANQDGVHGKPLHQGGGTPMPSCSDPGEAHDDELTRAALSDPGYETHESESQPTLWRLIFLVMVATLALTCVFLKR